MVTTLRTVATVGGLVVSLVLALPAVAEAPHGYNGHGNARYGGADRNAGGNWDRAQLHRAHWYNTAEYPHGRYPGAMGVAYGGYYRRMRPYFYSAAYPYYAGGTVYIAQPELQPPPPPPAPPETYVDNDSGSYCREYSQAIRVNGQPQEAYGTACLQPDGSWRVVQ